MRTEAEEEAATMATTTATTTVGTTTTTTRLTTRKPFSFCLPAFYLNWERETQTNQKEGKRERGRKRGRQTGNRSCCSVHGNPHANPNPSAYALFMSSPKHLRLLRPRLVGCVSNCQLPQVSDALARWRFSTCNWQQATCNGQPATCNLPLPGTG